MRSMTTTNLFTERHEGEGVHGVDGNTRRKCDEVDGRWNRRWATHNMTTRVERAARLHTRDMRTFE